MLYVYHPPNPPQKKKKANIERSDYYDIISRSKYQSVF